MMLRLMYCVLHHGATLLVPSFTKQQWDTEVYKGNFNEIVNKLNDEERHVNYFQQDGPTYHTSIINIKEIESLFENQVISKIGTLANKVT